MKSMQPSKKWQDYICLPEQDWSLMDMAFMVAEQLQDESDLSLSKDLLAQFMLTLKERVKGANSAAEQLERVNDYLFNELGFSSNQDDYFNADNSLINLVLTTRTGIPLTLSLLYLEMLSSLGMECNGINFPGHFLVGVKISGHYQIHDAFREGILLEKNEIKKMLTHHQIGINCDEELADYLKPASHRQVIIRLLRNLKNIYIEQQDEERSLQVIEMILSLEPVSSDEIRDRGMVYHYLDYTEGALIDLTAYLELEPNSHDRTIIEALIESLHEQSTPLH